MVKPVTTPSVLTDAVPVPATIDQVPPDCAFVNAGVDVFTQTVVAPPVLADKVGKAFTVREFVMIEQLLLLVRLTLITPEVVGVNVVELLLNF